jgi:hypothetical protein
MKAMLGLVNGLVTTRNMLRAKSLVAMGRAKRGGLRRTHTLYPRCKCLHRVIFNSVGALVGRKAGLLVITLLCLTISAAAQQGCPNCSCSGQWQTELVPPEPTRTVVSSTEHSGDNRYCAQVLVPALCLSGYEGIRVSGSACDNLDWGYDFWTRDTVRYKTECIPPEVVGPCQKYLRRIDNVKESQSKVYKCVSENGEELCRETRERTKYYFAKYSVTITLRDCQCEPLPAPVEPPEKASVRR